MKMIIAILAIFYNSIFTESGNFYTLFTGLWHTYVTEIEHIVYISYVPEEKGKFVMDPRIMC